ncbi:hypothetical protein ACRQFN_02295 [Actinotignum sp. GS-2025e]|uniref:hypothetical protein n=1 Tax=unclassified Actinotignum TaxID=2632702 RepID=UPI003F4694B5
MAVVVTAPIPFTGPSAFGNVTVLFSEGVATVDSLPVRVEEFLVSNGYLVAPAPEPAVEPEPATEPMEEPEPEPEPAGKGRKTSGN